LGVTGAVRGGDLAAAGTLWRRGVGLGVWRPGSRRGVGGWDGKRQPPPPIGPQRSIAPDGGAVTERSEGKGACDLDSPAAGATIIQVQGGEGALAARIRLPRRERCPWGVRLAIGSRALRIVPYPGISGYGGAPVTPRWRGEAFRRQASRVRVRARALPPAWWLRREGSPDAGGGTSADGMRRGGDGRG
jgi:hypothetical protein